VPLLPPDFLNRVVAIGTGRDLQTRKWVGTGFFYGVPTAEVDSEGNTLYTVFLISNKHVFEGRKEIWIKLDSVDGSASKDFRAAMVAKNGRKLWIGHPDDGVDVGALWVNAAYLQQQKRRISFFLHESQVLTAPKLLEAGVSEGDGVFLLGFPMGMVDKERQYPICRTGSIAKIGSVKDGSEKEILVDGLVYPGNSGGPVVTVPQMTSIHGTRPYRRASLIGVVAGYVPYQEIARSVQTGRPRMIFEENSGLTSVVPAEQVCETVLLAKKRVQNRFAQRRFQARKRAAEEQAEAGE